MNAPDSAERLALALAAIEAEIAARPKWPASCSPAGLRHAEDGGATDYADLDDAAPYCRPCGGEGELSGGGDSVRGDGRRCPECNGTGRPGDE